MKALLASLMFVNAALFLFGAIQHLGVTIGRLHEPQIIPAAVVETICGIALAFGATLISSRPTVATAAPLISNLIALAGVLLGMAALAAGHGPRTASNDLYHHVMVVLIGASLVTWLLAKTIFHPN